MYAAKENDLDIFKISRVNIWWLYTDNTDTDQQLILCDLYKLTVHQNQLYISSIVLGIICREIKEQVEENKVSIS